MIIYRYREAVSHNLLALENNWINGSLFKQFQDGTELNYDVSIDVLAKHNLSLDEKDRVLKLIANNIENKYYLACFTKVSPFAKNKMWINFAAKGNGYCLEYDDKDIVQAIAKQTFGAATLKTVEYSLEPYYLDYVIDHICSYDGVRKELENDDIDLAVAKANNIVRKQIIGAFVHKTIECVEEKEIRLILQCMPPAGTNNEIFNPHILVVKPRRIIISNKINIINKHRIIEYAKKNTIPYKIIDNI